MYDELKKVIDFALTPNQIYILMCLYYDEDIKIKSKDADIQLLIERKYIKDGMPTVEAIAMLKVFEPQKSKKINFSEIDVENLNKYREMFPKGLLPSGQASRVTIKELEKKMIWFFENYKYDWDIVLKATKKYIDKYSLEGYMYMKTSGYFISKSEKGMVVSTLASYCDMVLDGDDEDKNYNSQDVI